MFNIENRRYVGNKYKLMSVIREKINLQCKNCNSFLDVFAGTGSVANYLFDDYNEFIINDFLYSNEIIFKGFFLKGNYKKSLLNEIKNTYQNLESKKIKDNYFSDNFGNKFFGYNDSKIIGYIRDDIEKKYENKIINYKEYCILISSLIYSFDKISNTVGHYEAYIKNHTIEDNKLKFDLIEPRNVKNKKISIFRNDANELVKNVYADITFIDPPYNSRQYSRFYHLLETVTKWDKPELFGTAMKPMEENMSDYCRSNAPEKFSDLIRDINSKYIVVTYNNTYNSKSSSSKNKITLEEIENILKKKGKTHYYELPYKYFNAGKTKLDNHKEIVFITEVNKK